MSIKIISKLSPEWFTPKDQRKEETPTRFKIRQLNGVEHAEVMAELREDGGRNYLTFRGVMAALKGLLDWENVEDQNGEVTFSQSNLKMIPGDYLHEVAGAILEKSNISEEEEKK